MALSNQSLAGPGYIILNTIRVMNIIGFLAVIAASVVMLVKTTTVSKFFFFDAISHVVTAMTSSFLIVSELCLFPLYFARNWPLLSPEHGFVMLAVMMIVLGLDILGNLNKASDSQQALGLAFWRIVIGSGVLIFILGFFNLIASYVFRDKRQGITARMVRAHGAVAVHKTPMSCSITASSFHVKTPVTHPVSPITPTKTSAKNPLRLITTKLDNHHRNSVLPSYHTSPMSPLSDTLKPDPVPTISSSPTSRYSRVTACTKKKIMTSFHPTRSNKRESLAPPLPLNISAPIGVNPQFAHLVQRPDSALHPSRSNGAEGVDPYRWRANV